MLRGFSAESFGAPIRLCEAVGLWPLVGWLALSSTSKQRSTLELVHWTLYAERHEEKWKRNVKIHPINRFVFILLLWLLLLL